MMTALYRRYRPDTFEDVIGQEHVTKALQAALANGRVNHAYLFSGPRGCGKTTSARILARCLNCAQGPTATPCGTCDSCRDLATGGSGSLDVIEIDAASHGGVDDTRELRDRAAYAPARDRFKIFIIDEAHNVSKEGFNALLKLVEEPPDHIKFIFATTNPEKVISTIRSRTHHYPFRLVAPEVLRDYMAGLCRSEGVTAEDGVLGLVVRAGGGSVRDSLSILDQLIAGEAEPKLHYDRAVSLLGYTDSGLLGGMVDALVSGSGADAYTVVDRMIQTGHEPRRFVEDLLQYLRDLVVMKLAGAGAGAVLGDLPESELAAMRPQVAALTPRTLTRCAELVDNGLTEMVGAASPRLALELLVAKLLLATSDDAASTAAEGATSTVRVAAKATESGARDSEPVLPPAAPMYAQTPPQGAPTSAVAGSAGPVARPDRSAPPDRSVPQPAPVSTTQREAGPVSQAAQTKAPREEKWEFKPTPWDIPGENSNRTESLTSSVQSVQKSVPRDTQTEPPTPASAPAGVPAAPAQTSAPVHVAASAQSERPAQPGTGRDGDYEKIRSNWGKIMARLKQNHAATGNLLETHGQLQGMRGSTVEIAFPNPGLVRAFGERHTSALAAVIQGFTGLHVEVRGVVDGFGAPAAAPIAPSESHAAPPEHSAPPEDFSLPPDPADFEPEMSPDWHEPPAQPQSRPAEPTTAPTAPPEPLASAVLDEPAPAAPETPAPVLSEPPAPVVPSEEPTEPTPVTAPSAPDSRESSEPRQQDDPQDSKEMKPGIQTAQAMLGGTIINPKLVPGSSSAKAGW
ncbi:DNA polymerase III subunit gamma and tau [Mobiluncus curtisii]|uniref:DNA polymerase III subunit gamma and tau n=1 Tax=Mobiluncus curtisii TaxID=2051 RepID=UPI00146FE1B1|nr:DNA polymerase III subunit gamma and tau [Mobiluncus curtisii]NMW45331.1 DNA polymerase III subunit gamma and tau [Mobiluncus curtisii]